MRIGIDARFYGPANKGLGRYTQEIVDNAIRLDEENEYIIFLAEENYDDFCCLSDRVKKVLMPIRWYSLAEQTNVPGYIRRAKIDLMHFPHFNVPIFTGTPFVVTIHDLILTKFPTMRATTLSPLKYFFKNILYRIVIRTAMRRSRKIIAVSEFTKNDIVNYFGVSPEKIDVIYEGVAIMGENQANQQTNISTDKSDIFRYNIDSFILYVGNAYPHKNLEKLIDIFAQLHRERQDLRLILVGKEDYFYNRLQCYAEGIGVWKKNDSDSPVLFAGYVDDDDLYRLYQKAICYVFPSMYEGFGLPPLEAMAAGCPVVSSNSASMPEILGDAALYFNPGDENEMKDCIVRLINDPRLRAELVSRGDRQYRKYSWRNCIERTLEIYRKSGKK